MQRHVVDVSGEFEKQMLKYMVSLSRGMQDLRREVRDVKRTNSSSGTLSPASSQEGGEGSTRTKIPCTTKQQLEHLESMLNCFPHVYRELVRMSQMKNMNM